ncbi:splicing factor YJU2 [Aplysia californica]|uniref:Splicing factor YJU2 n=1 Tax=Aplysia californica TaxID=6500 RepID=A0ABM0JN63_APLCA|nr:splicing factor YJU2 [Aplysia californica]
MSERKVLNKYYPPEFDPSKIPKLKQPRNRTFSIRIMAPFNMRCNTCGEYIYKGKKFNSRKENVDDEDYLGLRIFRFYIKCPRCVAEIAFKTDLANTDYAMEAGATRLFEAEKLAHQMAEKERKEKEEDELNPMKVLENRTKASRNEMDQLDQLEELREMNARHAKVNHEKMLEEHMAYEEQLLKLQEEEEDRLVQAILKKGTSGEMIRRIDDATFDEEATTTAKKARLDNEKVAAPTDLLAEAPSAKSEEKPKESWQRSVGTFSKKTSLAGLVKRKTPTKPSSSTPGTSSTNATTNGHTEGKPSGQPDNRKSTMPSVSSTSSGPESASNVQSSKDDAPKSSALGALGMLGGYSDSEESNSD